MILPVSKSKRGGWKPLTLVVIAMLAAPAAAADGVIVKSSLVEYPIGSLVADGEVLRLGAGQTVTILDRSGVLIERSAGAYAGPSARAGASLVELATGVAAGPQSKSAIGGTRNDDEKEKCNFSNPKTADACIPHGVIAKRLRVAGYVPVQAGAEAQLVLESNFNGYAVCAGWNGLEDSRFIAGADPAHPVELSAETPVRLGPAVLASSGPAPGSVACTGVSIDVWKSLTPSALQALDPNSVGIVLSSFSRLRGDTIAEDRAKASSLPHP
jgi:hypothetical protein